MKKYIEIKYKNIYWNKYEIMYWNIYVKYIERNMKNINKYEKYIEINMGEWEKANYIFLECWNEH